MTAQRRVSALRLPLTTDCWGILQMPFPLSEHEWERMIELLLAMRRGLVQSGVDIETEPVIEWAQEASADV